jgi:hypothetical protein
MSIAEDFPVAGAVAAHRVTTMCRGQSWQIPFVHMNFIVISRPKRKTISSS